MFTLEHIAKVCHEANSALREILGEDPNPRYEDAPFEMRQSVVRGIMLRIEHPETTPEAQHEAWRADYVRDGWTWGPVKDREAKTHPCLVPYAELPEGQRMKDYVYCAIVDAMKAGAGAR